MDKSVEGYLHNVSPVKTSRNSGQYFNATLQTGYDTYSDVVCFGSEKRSLFRSCAESASPVKLVNVTLAPGKRRADASDVQCDKRVRMETAALDYHVKSPPESPVTTLAEIKNTINEFQKVTAMVKVVSADSDVTTHNKKNGTGTVKRRNFTIADTSESMQLSAWENMVDRIEVGKCYLMKNITVRVFADVKFVNTNLETQVTGVEHESLANLHVDAVQNQAHPRYLGRISEIRVYRNKYCGSCKKSLPDASLGPRTTLCGACGMRMRAKDLAMNTFAKMGILDGSNVAKGVTCFGTTLDVFLASLDLKEPCTVDQMEADVIEETFLDQGDLLFTVNETDNIVMYIEKNAA